MSDSAVNAGPPVPAEQWHAAYDTPGPAARGDVPATGTGRTGGLNWWDEAWRAALADHYLMGINCDPETHQDNPMCGCSRIHLGWYPSIGEARQAWIDHVTAVVADADAAADGDTP